MHDPILFPFPPEYACKNCELIYDLILFSFTCPVTPAKAGALGRGLYPILFHWGSRQRADTNDPSISYLIPLYLCDYICKNWGSRQRTYMNNPIILFFPAEYPCKNWGSTQGAYTNDPFISYPILLYLPKYACKNWGSRQGVYTYEIILDIPDKIAVIPSKYISPDLQLR